MKAKDKAAAEAVAADNKKKSSAGSKRGGLRGGSNDNGGSGSVADPSVKALLSMNVDDFMLVNNH